MTFSVEQVWSALPRGHSLDDPAWERRHRRLVGVVLLHVPALGALGLLRGFPAVQVVLEPAPLLLAAGLGWLGRSRMPRAVVVTLGLMYAGTVAAHFSGGLAEAHFHSFLLLALLASYQDWRPFGVSVAYVLAVHGVLSVVAPGVISSHTETWASPWLWPLLHATFLGAVSTMYVVFWTQAEREHQEASRYYRELVDRERSLVARLRDTQVLKDELVSVVGHEFRTPLTSIMGFAQTLSARLDDMDREGARRSARAIDRQAKRLTRMVANLLTASSELVPAADDASNLRAAVDEAVADVLELAPASARDIQVSVPAGLEVAMSPSAAYQVLFNLLDNAVKFADHQTSITVATRREDGDVVLEVTNVGPAIPEGDRERIFEAFVQADSSETRRYGGIGLGLHIVRKIVEAHRGRVGVYCEGPVVIFRTWLPAAAHAAAPAASVSQTG